MLQFLHSKRTLFPFSLVLIWVLFPFFKTSHEGYCSPLSECCRIMLHFSTLTQRGYCSHSPQVLIWVLFPFLDYCSTRVQFTWIRMLQENIVSLCFYSPRVLFPFSASAHTGTFPTYYSLKVLSDMYFPGSQRQLKTCGVRLFSLKDY